MHAGMTIPCPLKSLPGAVARLIAAVVLVLLPAVAGAVPVLAQTAAMSPQPVIVPGFWDPRRRPERPDLSRIQAIRFLTEVDYPPFDYAGADGNPAGLNVRS